MAFTYLHTERLKLRLANQEVFDQIFSECDYEQLATFFGKDAVDKEIKRHEGGSSSYNKTFLYFHLLLKDTNELIGWCGYHTWYLDHSRAEIGYMLFDEKFMDKGYMTEAMQAVIDYGFHEMGLHRIEAMVGLYNRPSLRLMNKFGFEKEGQLKEHYFTGGIYEDSLVYGLIKPAL